ncbi:MAG: PhoH-like protein [Candidatus Ordinivivax streblomastigis]|uniref:PhoH-like protein n=1 Tax=Candidatus Ordinivivax streblomastigis TaxID=2540710 RepID=A0A5M8P1M6_9BACT|nr:MAG: PhoH-like protein [Candidatus Ordinivivax streblomastigis]
MGLQVLSCSTQAILILFIRAIIKLLIFFEKRIIIIELSRKNFNFAHSFFNSMLERNLILEGADPATFFGINNSNIQFIKSLYPKLRIVARGNVMKVIGDELELAAFEEKIREMEIACQAYNVLTEETIINIIKGQKDATVPAKQDHLIIFGMNGKPIMARSENQQKLVRAFEENDMVFAIGPAGSGKTYTAIALAVRALKNKEVKKIILSRPAVEAGEKLGFLPGDMKEKIDPYLQPLYDALEDMIPLAKLKEYIENKVIQIAPLAFMRGRTLSDAVIILDEAQNTSTQQIKMFLTRLGMNAKMIITGDVTQIDLPPAQQSGLIHAIRLLKNVQGITQIELGKEDIVRHKLVQRIVEEYEKQNEKNEKMKEINEGKH